MLRDTRALLIVSVVVFAPGGSQKGHQKPTGLIGRSQPMNSDQKWGGGAGDAMSRLSQGESPVASRSASPSPTKRVKN